MFPLEGRYFAKGGEACTEEPNESSQYPCGVAPEEGSPAQLLQDLYLKARDTATIEDRHAVVWETIDVIVEQGPFVIGVGGDQPMPIIVKDHMRNILDFGVWTSVWLARGRLRRPATRSRLSGGSSSDLAR